jgi:hypothetical protein
MKIFLKVWFDDSDGQLWRGMTDDSWPRPGVQVFKNLLAAKVCFENLYTFSKMIRDIAVAYLKTVT